MGKAGDHRGPDPDSDHGGHEDFDQLLNLSVPQSANLQKGGDNSIKFRE